MVEEKEEGENNVWQVLNSIAEPISILRKVG